MVFYGLPSKGCERCRKSKKRCSLDWPACKRCERAGLVCFGREDATDLVFRDQTEKVRQKVQLQQTQRPGASPPAKSALQRVAPTNAKRSPCRTVCDSPPLGSGRNGIRVTITWPTGRHISNAVILKPSEHIGTDQINELGVNMALGGVNPSSGPNLNLDDVATTIFLERFASTYNWNFVGKLVQERRSYPCLDLAARACGMATLANVHHAARKTEHARLRYGAALNLLNQGLRNAEMSVSDESLIVVLLLGHFERIMGNWPRAVSSWESHIEGATRMLQLRGKTQLRCGIGRSLFRNTRRQILVHCMWNDREPPSFLEEFQSELANQSLTAERVVFEVEDELSVLKFDLAKLRAQVSARSITDVDAEVKASDLDRRLVAWSEEAPQKSAFWRYHETEVSDSEHVWDGKVAVYSSHPAPEVWNSWRCVRIMLSRVRETLCQRLGLPESIKKDILDRERALRRRMGNDICASIPSCLNTESSSNFKVAPVQGAVWPLYFAATCALERLPKGSLSVVGCVPPPPVVMHSAAFAQSTWILGRLRYVADDLGMKWAAGVMNAIAEADGWLYSMSKMA